MNNLKLAQADLTEKQIYTACQNAQCHDFISQLPQGYDTPIGESGNLLSGGEKQRLALARALLCNAKIILLDEISSALDVRNERALLNLLHELKKDRTLIMIAHRESMVRNADQVLYLQKGKLANRGTHSQLLADDLSYQKLWNHVPIQA